MRIRKVVSLALCLVITMTSAFMFTGCGSKTEPATTILVDANRPYMEYLGEFDYTSGLAAMVYEQVEGEDPGFYGIQYRKVEDLGGLSTQGDIAICLYFYSSLNNSAAFVTADVEDLAQTLTGQVLFVAIDVVGHEDISKAYDIYNCPDFVLINQASRISTFDIASHEEWTINDVAAWIKDNGFIPDYSRLDQ